jgi:hypothetical protein
VPWKRFGKISKEDLATARREGRRKARFLLDENIDRAVTDLIRKGGWSVVHAEDAGLTGQPDENIFALASRDNHVLLTHDADFLDNRRFPPHLNSGLIIIPLAGGNRAKILEALQTVLLMVGDHRDLWHRTKISITEDGTWTVRTYERDVGRVVESRYRFRKGRPIEYWED